MQPRPPTPSDSVEPSSVLGAATTPRSQRTGSTGHGTTLVNLDVFIQCANIGHDISLNDTDLIVLFRRNSKEVASEPAPWTTDHCARWNQHVSIQTSLLRHTTPHATEFRPKEYDIVLVALPSHSAVALFSLDFATLVQLNVSRAQDRSKSFRITPRKCRDLAATLELEISWDVQSTWGSSASSSAPSYVPLLSAASQSSQVSRKPVTTPTPTLKVQTPRSRHGSRSRCTDTTLRRTTASLSSAGSEQELLEELSLANCSTCRTAKRRLDRKDVQVLQLESFLKESQKRIDALCTENDELIVRERAETRHAAQQRVLTLRLLQELEAAVQLCLHDMQGHDTTLLLPQVELIARVKQLHDDASPRPDTNDSLLVALPSSALDFQAETAAALERNQRLQQQLEFLSRSMDHDGTRNDDDVPLRSWMPLDAGLPTTTRVSAQSEPRARDGSEQRPVALTMTHQLNNLERENFKLRAELEEVLTHAAARAVKKYPLGYAASYSTGRSLTAEISETASSSSRDEMDDTELEDAVLLSRIREQHELEARRSAGLQLALDHAAHEIQKLQDQLVAAQADRRLASEAKEASHAPGFLDKIYADVGKAKLDLEDRVKQLDAMLARATDENGRLRNEIEALQGRSTDDQAYTTAAMDAVMADLTRRCTEQEGAVKATKQQLETTTQQRDDAVARARASEDATLALTNELAAVRRLLNTAHEDKRIAVELTGAEPASTRSVSRVTPRTTASDGMNSSEELAEVQKQLKLSKQEVMQLRFRSHQFETVRERLEETLKEKRTLEVKLTALEGQLFEQRNRTLQPDNSSRFAAAVLDAKSTTMLTEMQREMDQKAAQLLMAEQEIARLRDQLMGVESRPPGKLADVAVKVQQFETEIARLCQRNDDQAVKLQQLGDRVTSAVRERDELEELVQQMVTEMALLGKDVATDDSAPLLAEGPKPAPLVQLDHITDRYATAVACSHNVSRTPSALPPSVTSNKVSQLVKTFSA